MPYCTSLPNSIFYFEPGTGLLFRGQALQGDAFRRWCAISSVRVLSPVSPSRVASTFLVPTSRVEEGYLIEWYSCREGFILSPCIELGASSLVTPVGCEGSAQATDKGLEMESLEPLSLGVGACLTEGRPGSCSPEVFPKRVQL